MNLIETNLKIEAIIHPGEIMPGARVTYAGTYRHLPADIILDIDSTCVWEEDTLRELASSLLVLADALEIIDNNNEELASHATLEDEGSF